MADPMPLPDPIDAFDTAIQPHVDGKFVNALLFTGHMIDRPGRAQPRFPAWAERNVRQAIRTAIQHIDWADAGALLGMGGAASGGDLLFHEVCDELQIPTRILLALPPQEFIADSVAPAGETWIDRFQSLIMRRGTESLSVMPARSNRLDNSTTVWERANLWMIDEAIAAAPHRSLLALWDGARGDGPGGTEHFIQSARVKGLRVLEPIPMQSLLR